MRFTGSKTNLSNEATIMRALAVIALAAAFIVTIVIAVNAGIVGGDGAGDSREMNGSAVAPEAAPEAEPAAGGQDAAAPAGEAGETEPITLETETYIVQDGDSFFSIASKYNTTIDELLRLNPTVNPQNLKPGTELAVPRAG